MTGEIISHAFHAENIAFYHQITQNLKKKKKSDIWFPFSDCYDSQWTTLDPVSDLFSCNWIIIGKVHWSAVAALCFPPSCVSYQEKLRSTPDD